VARQNIKKGKIKHEASAAAAKAAKIEKHRQQAICDEISAAAVSAKTKRK